MTLEAKEYQENILSEFLDNHEEDFEDIQTSKDLVKKYPKMATNIFAMCLYNCGYSMKDSDVKYFVDNGAILDTNEYKSDAGGTTALGHVCEYRHYHLIKQLVELGADPNLEDAYGFTPLESAIIGHSASDSLCDAEKCVKILIECGAKNELQKMLFEENFTKPRYKMDEPSKYLIDFLNNVSYRDTKKREDTVFT